MYSTDFPEIHAILTENEVEQESIELESFRTEQCLNSSELTLESVELASVAVENQIPVEFVSAVEAEKMIGKNYDMRPHIHDKLTNEYLLYDSGAQVSACPPDPGDVIDPKVALRSVNGSRLNCYGFKEIDIQINRKKYPVKMIKTHVQKPILGWDFTRRHRLSSDWTEFGDAVIIDKKNGIRSVMKYKAIPTSHPRKLATFSTVCAERKSSREIEFEVSAMEALTKETESIIDDLESMPESDFKNLIKKYPELLKLQFDQEEPKNGVLHRIHTTGQPCRAKARRLAPGSPKAVKGLEAIQNLEKLGIIERVDPNEPNHYSSPVHFVWKPDGSLRTTGDYRLLNQRTVLDLYPLPELRSFTDQMAGSLIFSKIDLTKAFHQILIDKRDRHKTCLATPWGLFNFRRLTMGMGRRR